MGSFLVTIVRIRKLQPCHLDSEGKAFRDLMWAVPNRTQLECELFFRAMSFLAGEVEQWEALGPKGWDPEVEFSQVLQKHFTLLLMVAF